jgi:hypothetical protein
MTKTAQVCLLYFMKDGSAVNLIGRTLIFKISGLFGISNFGHWDLFEIWCLEFVI